MSADIKLYKHFVQEIGKMGRIKRAWFTTFNFDIGFFEKYILSALSGVSYTELRNPYDYESINKQLTNDGDFTEEDSMEVKVFCDFRAEMQTGRQKRTVVPVYKVNVAEIGTASSNRFFQHGVFHPKVILLESYLGEYWIMVSSANLTFGGWSSNRESFFCSKITSTRTAREVGQFLAGLTQKIPDCKSHPLVERLQTGRFGNEDPGWKFVSSFGSSTFIDEMNHRAGSDSLMVWSPYFSTELPAIIEELQGQGYDSIQIIPAKTGAQRIRLTDQTHQQSIGIKGVQFRQEVLSASLQDVFVHGKVWLTPKQLAIGSWNMTRGGMNTSKNGKNNVEAGVILKLKPKQYQEIIDRHKTKALSSPVLSTQEELDKEKEELLDSFTVVTDLVIDWDSLKIRLLRPSYDQLITMLSPSDCVKLPALGKLKVHTLKEGISIRGCYEDFLRDRYYEIESQKGETLFSGYLLEMGLMSRPVNSFPSIDDYLKGWVSAMPEAKTDWHRPAYSIDEEYGDDFSADTKRILFSADQNAWFTSFQAFESMIERIKVTAAMPARDRKLEWKRIGRVLPGSLSELRKHLVELLDLYQQEPTSFKKSPIYLWFLIEKSNQVFHYFNSLSNSEDEAIIPIKNLNWEQLLSADHIRQIGAAELKRWVQFISQKLKVA